MSKPWSPLFVYLHTLAALGEGTQKFLDSFDWTVSPSRFYQWFIEGIEYLRTIGAPTFDQPSWLMLVEIFKERVADLEGSATNLMLTQEMESWRDFDFFDKRQGNPYQPYIGPLYDIVSAHDDISPAIRRGTATLERESGDKDVDIVGRTMTVGECVNVVWNLTKAFTNAPFMQTQHPTVPDWTITYPWLDFCYKELTKLRDELKDETPSIGSRIGTTPFSMPEV